MKTTRSAVRCSSNAVSGWRCRSRRHSVIWPDRVSMCSMTPMGDPPRGQVYNAPMRGHVLGIDHVVILTHDLERARDTYARLGFTLTPRGYHTLGSQNHCIMFDRDYVELMAVPKPHPAFQYFSDYLARGEGVGAIALATDDADAAHAEITSAGIAAEAPLA